MSWVGPDVAVERVPGACRHGRWVEPAFGHRRLYHGPGAPVPDRHHSAFWIDPGGSET